MGHIGILVRIIDSQHSGLRRRAESSAEALSLRSSNLTPIDTRDMKIAGIDAMKDLGWRRFRVDLPTTTSVSDGLDDVVRNISQEQAPAFQLDASRSGVLVAVDDQRPGRDAGGMSSNDSPT